jgi:alpha-galactosidase
MTKIAFIGAGSLGFTRALVRDVLTFPLLEDATLALMDIDAERLEFAQKSVQRIVDVGNYSATVEATMDRVEALKDADAVLCTILAGDTDPLSASVLSLAEIKEMVNEMLRQNQDHLPQFEHFVV